MRKIVVGIMALIIILPSVAFAAASGVKDWYQNRDGQWIYEVTLSANEAYTLLNMSRVTGGWLMNVEVHTSADDAVGVTLTNARGTDLLNGNGTTTAATDGEYVIPNDRWAINSALTLTSSAIASGTATFVITVAK